MNSRDLIAMGLRNLWRRKARTFLTVLGVIIGTASIIVMLSLGIGMQETFMKNLEDMGSISVIDVYPKWDRYSDDEEDSGPQKKIALDDKAVEQIRQIDDVIGVMPFMNVYVDILAGRYEAGISINGVDVDQMDKFDFMVEQGRLPTKFGKNEIVFGREVSQQFYDPKSRSRRWEPVEIDLMEANLKMILNEEYNGNGRPRGRKLNVVGILAESNGEYNWNAYMDIDQLTKIQEEVARRNKSSDSKDKRRRDDDENKYENVKVKVDDIDNVQEVQETIKAMGLEAWSLSDILENMKQTSAGIQAVLGGIGAVSLFVAALGITNTMIMSIYERTREIGVMKVLGAELKDIKRLFLFEAGLIGLLGGLIGIVLSLGVSKAMNSVGFNFMNGGYGDASNISVIPLWLIGLSLVFSILVGVISGYYPARRAMKLSALEAIRTDS